MSDERKTRLWKLVFRYIHRRWRVAAPVAIISTAIFAGLAVMWWRSGEKHRPPLAPAPGVAEGVVESRFAREVGAPFEGTLAAVRVRPGQRVHKGELLFRMDTAALQGELAQVQGELQAARDALHATRASEAADLRDLEAAASGIRGAIAQASRQPIVITPAGMQGAPSSGDMIYTAEDDGDQAASSADDAGAQAYSPDQHQFQANPQQFQAPRAVQDGPSPADLRSQLEAVLWQIRSKQQGWAAPVHQAEADLAACERRAASVRSRLAAAAVAAPVNGTVTRVDGAAGQAVGSKDAVVRIDNPVGYRIVTLVDGQEKDAAKHAGSTVVRVPEGGAVAARVDCVTAGEGKQAFYYWLRLKPVKPAALTPGETVQVSLPDGGGSLYASGQ